MRRLQKELEEGRMPKCWNCEEVFSSCHRCWKDWNSELLCVIENRTELLLIHEGRVSPCWGLFWRRRQITCHGAQNTVFLCLHWIKHFRKKGKFPYIIWQGKFPYIIWQGKFPSYWMFGFGFEEHAWHICLTKMFSQNIIKLICDPRWKDNNDKSTAENAKQYTWQIQH